MRAMKHISDRWLNIGRACDWSG